MGIRFPLHRQEYTEHNSSPYFEVPDNLDVVIAETKSNGQPFQFNKCLKRQDNYEAWIKLLNWLGILEGADIYNVALELNILVQPILNNNRKYLLSTKPINTKFGAVTIRPIIFSPNRIEINNTDKFINWTEINNFIWQCLCPAEIREECGTRYDFKLWGLGISEIVKVYKDRQRTQTNFKNIEQIYSEVEVLRR